MAKGGKRDNAGRPKGVPNSETALAREAIAKFVDNNSQRLQEWLDRIAEDSPEKAFNAVRDLLEYHVPKLARTELQNLDKEGKPADQKPMNFYVNGVKADVKHSD